ncbi:MAG: autotransporter outer membrane beta-barrel domain-containing protein [Devosia sp.]
MTHAIAATRSSPLLRFTLLLSVATPALLAAGSAMADPVRTTFTWNADPQSYDPTTEPWAAPSNWLADLSPAVTPPTIEDVVEVGYGGAAITEGVEATAYSLSLTGGLNVNAGAMLTVTAGIVNAMPEGVYFINAGAIYGDVDTSSYLSNAGRIEGQLTVREGASVYNETAEGGPTAVWEGDVDNAGDLNNGSALWQGDVLSNSGGIFNYDDATWVGDVISNTGSIVVQDTASWYGTVYSNAGGLALDSADASWNGDVVASTGSITSSGSWNGSISSTGWLFLSGYVQDDVSSTDLDPDNPSLFSVTGDLDIGRSLTVDGTLSMRAAEGAQTLSAASLSLGDNSVLEIDIDDAGNSDKLAIGGAASLAGRVYVGAVFGPGYVEGMPYTVLTADSITGAFDSEVGTDLAFLTPTLEADGTTVSLVLTRNGSGFADAASSPNDKAAAAAIEALGPGNPLYNATVNLSGDSAATAFSGLAGEVHLVVPSTLIATSTAIAGTVTDHLRQSFDALGTGPAPTAYAADVEPVAPAAAPGGAWGTVYGLRTETAAETGQAGSFTTSAGFVAGADTMLAGWRVGGMVEVGKAGTDMSGLAASVETTSYGAGLYAGQEWGDTRLLLGGNLSGHAIQSTRTVDLGGSQTLEADYAAASALAFAELSQRIDLGAVELTPRLGLSHVRYGTDGFSETGGDAALTSAASTYDATFAALGLDIGRQFAVGDGVLVTATGTLGWRRGFGDAPAAEYAFAGGDGFAVAGTAPRTDTLLLGADLALDLDASTSLRFGYAGTHADGTTTQSLSANLNGRF